MSAEPERAFAVAPLRAGELGRAHNLFPLAGLHGPLLAAWAGWALQPRRRLVALAVSRARGAGVEFELYVLPGQRERGLEAPLLEALLAHTPGDAPLVCRTLVPQGGGAARFLQNQGFVPGSSVQAYELDYASIRARIGRIHSRCRARQRPPAHQLLALDEAPRAAVREALGRTALLDVDSFDFAYGDPRGSGLAHLSSVLIVEAAIVGLLLTARSEHPLSVEISAVWVAPPWRGGWALPALYQRAITAAEGLNIRSLSFTADTLRAPDTVHLARAMGARAHALKCRMQRP